jgi:hypothetical protein
MASITIFPDEEGNIDDGTGLTLSDSVTLLAALGFENRISSVIVTSGTFTLFVDRDFQGANFTVCSRGGPFSNGRYPSPLSLAGRNDTISSIARNSDEPI